MPNIIKSLFYGLWNFDKMINQHNLSTRISELLVRVPKKSALMLFRGLVGYLTEKWNLIDHHRINKFMQLVRYLLRQAFKMCEKYKINHAKIDAILLETVYKDQDTSNKYYYDPFRKRTGLSHRRYLLLNLLRICPKWICNIGAFSSILASDQNS